jgi:hypothetical protein
MRYRYQLVERIPKPMSEGVVYHTEKFGLAGLLCACGCGHPITLLVPDSHQVRAENGYATISPSVGVLDAACKSHFFVTAGEVEMLRPFTGSHAAYIMHAQIARHVAREAKPSWWQKVRALAFDMLRKLRP